jgi:hypothetical protein
MSGKKPAAAKGAKPAATKAKAAAKSARIGARKANVKVHYKVHFYKPKTLEKPRDPKYMRTLPKAVAKKDKFRCVPAVCCERRGGCDYCRLLPHRWSWPAAPA